MSDRPQTPPPADRCGPTRKVRFRSHEAAMARAVEIVSREDYSGDGFRSYYCKLCGGWHLTTELNR